MHPVRDPRSGVTPRPENSPAPGWPTPERVEGPDEGQALVNGAFGLCGYHARAIVVPSNEPNPAEGLPHVGIALSHGHHLVLMSEGPTGQELESLARLKRTSEECGRQTTFFDDWRVFEARIFGGGYYVWGYEPTA